LVEDDPMLGLATCEALRVAGHHGAVADTVAAAYKHLSSAHPFEVILFMANSPSSGPAKARAIAALNIWPLLGLMLNLPAAPEQILSKF
jgi:DNA-binding response OmpR family regulator